MGELYRNHPANALILLGFSGFLPSRFAPDSNLPTGLRLSG